MTHISWERARRSCSRAARGAAALGLAALLAWGQVPAAAWAEAADAVAAAAQSAPEATAGDGSAAGKTGEAANSSAASGADKQEPADSDESSASHGTASAVDEANEDAAAHAAPTGQSGVAASQTANGQEGGAQTAEQTADEQRAADERQADAGASDENSGPAPAEQADEQITVQVALYGRNAQGETETWAEPQNITIDAVSSSGKKATAGDAFIAMLEARGITSDVKKDEKWNEVSFSSITSPFDPTVVLVNYASGNDSWQFFKDGAFQMLPGAIDGAAVDGASYAWCFGSDHTLPQPEKQSQVSVEIMGIDAQGNAQRLVNTTLDIEDGMKADEVTQQVLEAAGVTYSDSTSQYGWSLDSITMPDGRMLGTQEVNGAYLYWQFWVDGELSDLGSSSVELHDGMTIAWYYATWGASYPENGVAANPNASAPDWQGSAGFGQGSTTASTPASGAQTAWDDALKNPTDWTTNISDPLYYHGYLYVCAGSTIIMKDPATGEELRRATLVEPIDSIARMVATNGLIIVPVHDGRLQALTADTLTTVWFTDALPPYALGASGQDQQGLGSITVDGDRLYFVTAAAGWSDVYNGYVMCVDIATGTVLWKYENEASCYYWGGAAVSGSWVVVADDAGTASVLDAAQGTVNSSLDLGAGVRAQVVSGSEAGTYFVVTKDGVLHKLQLDEGAGELRELASVKFGSSSTSTPTVAGGKVYVGGASLEGYEVTVGESSFTSYYGTIAVIDEQTLTLEHRIVSMDSGAKLPATVQSSPLVSQQGGNTYVYFTCNAQPGGIYCYRVGDANAQLIYTPDADGQNYSMSSIVCGSDGTLYYINDSGKLFAVRAAAPADTVTDTTDTDSEPDEEQGPKSPAPDSDDTDNRGGAGNGSRGGAVRPALQPVSDDAVAGADDEGVATEDAEAADAGDAGVASASARMAEGAVSESGRRGLPRWVPVAGIAAGVCGLAAIGAYLTVLRKRV